MEDPQTFFNETFEDLTRRVANEDITGDTFTAAVRNLKLFSDIAAPPCPPKPDPTTKWGKTKAGVGKVLDNETTRTLIKAGGAFAGVLTVTYATIKRDHVLERTALAQANQRPL